MIDRDRLFDELDDVITSLYQRSALVYLMAKNQGLHELANIAQDSFDDATRLYQLAAQLNAAVDEQ